jgi:phage terminase large subunit
MPTIDLGSVVKLHPRQMEAYRALGKYSYIFYGGARGGGKTHLAVVAAYLAALQFPGLVVVAMRRFSDEVRRVLLQRFSELFGRFEGVLHRYYRSTRVVQLENGSQIHFVSADDPDKAAKELGAEVHFYILDEANHFEVDFLRRITGSLRNTTVPGWKPTVLYTGNPGGISDDYFIARFITRDPEKLDEYERSIMHEFLYIPARVYDNPTLLERDPDYVRRLQALPQAIRRAWLDGEWGVFEGKFFSTFSREVHVIPGIEIEPGWLRWRAVDLGEGTHFSVCLWFARSPDGTTYVYREYASKEPWTTFAERIAQLSGPGEASTITYADRRMFAPQALKGGFDAAKSIFYEYHIPVVPAQDAREYGWRLLLDAFAQKQLYITSGCTGVITALERAILHPSKFDIQRFDYDDYLDALRYGIASRPSQLWRPPAPPQEEEKPLTIEERLRKRRQEAVKLARKTVRREREPHAVPQAFVSPYVL